MHDSMTVVISTVTLLANQCTSEPTACIPGNTEMLLSLAMQKGLFQKLTLLRLKNRDIYVNIALPPNMPKAEESSASAFSTGR